MDAVIAILLTQQSDPIQINLLNYFHCSANTASTSAFVQQRTKLLPSAMKAIFSHFSEAIDPHKCFKGYRLLAVDGTTLPIPYNPNDESTLHRRSTNQKSNNELLITALFDLESGLYTDSLVQTCKDQHERAALIQLLDNLPDHSMVVIIGDRGFEGYNVLAHLQEKGIFFLIRAKDTESNGIVSGLDLPDEDEFDFHVNLSLFRKHNRVTEELARNKNHYKFISHSTDFDFLPSSSSASDPLVTYQLSFRVVRFRLPDSDNYETIITNLDAVKFPPDLIKEMYHRRWGIETSFRQLKYIIGLLRLHSKKVENIMQEIYASLTMFNYTAAIAQSVLVIKEHTKYKYHVNFASAAYLAVRFFLGNIAPPELLDLLSHRILPIRPGRKNPRNKSSGRRMSFNYVIP